MTTETPIRATHGQLLAVLVRVAAEDNPHRSGSRPDESGAPVPALDIETQGGRGAAEDRYRPANRPGVIATVRGHPTRIVADRLTRRDTDGHLHMLYAR